MPSLSSRTDRHVVIDHRPGHYLCFPDVCLTRDGRLLTAYNEFDKHVGARRKLLLKESRDLGRTWSEPRILRADNSHCPRLTRLSDGHLVIGDDSGPTLIWSMDNGRSWAQHPAAGISHGLIDRMLELDGECLLTTGHNHRGSVPHPKTRQATTEQMVYRSGDRGRTWAAHSVLAHDPCLVLCEASMLRLPDGRLLALMRENSFVYEPMYACLSEDGGDTWSDPRPTCLIGHRPTLGLTASGRLLVTYRNTGPDAGTCAWSGTLEDLWGFSVHGLAPDPGNPVLTPDGLLIKNDEGPDSPARYALRPLTDPERAAAELEAQVLCRSAQDKACAIRFGLWWNIFPDRIAPDLDDAGSVPLPRNRFNTLRLIYTPGRVTLLVNGETRMTCPVDARSADTRPILFGCRSPREENGGEHLWKRMKLRILEPRYERDYTWTWHAAWGLPDARARSGILEIMNDRSASSPDFGYSGWTQLPDGRFFCAFHHGGGHEPGYAPMHTARVMGAWFEESDFGGTAALDAALRKAGRTRQKARAKRKG